jgi:Ecdysteroid kinase-like family
MSRTAPPLLVTSIDGVDAGWLTSVLRAASVLGPGAAVEIVAIEPAGEGAAFASSLYRVRLSGPDGAPRSVIVKLPVGGAIRPFLDAMGAYTRELAFYREVAADAPLRSPRALLAEQATDSTDFVLVLEDLAPLESADQLSGLTLEQCERVIDDLARFHAFVWESPRLQDLAMQIPAFDSDLGRQVQAGNGELFAMSWPNCLQVAADRLDLAMRPLGDRFRELIPFFLEALSRPRTIAHGDLRADNLIFDADGAPYVIDFQITQQAAGVCDVAYLVSQSLATDLRRDRDESLVKRYWDGLVAAGVDDYPWEQAWEQYRIGVAFSLMNPIAAALKIDEVPARGKASLLAQIGRASAAIVDNDCLALLP